LCVEPKRGGGECQFVLQPHVKGAGSKWS